MFEVKLLTGVNFNLVNLCKSDLYCYEYNNGEPKKYIIKYNIECNNKYKNYNLIDLNFLNTDIDYDVEQYYKEIIEEKFPSNIEILYYIPDFGFPFYIKDNKNKDNDDKNLKYTPVSIINKKLNDFYEKNKTNIFEINMNIKNVNEVTKNMIDNNCNNYDNNDDDLFFIFDIIFEIVKTFIEQERKELDKRILEERQKKQNMYDSLKKIIYDYKEPNKEPSTSIENEENNYYSNNKLR